MSRDKLGLFAFGLTLLGFIILVRTNSYILFSIGIVSVAFLIFSKTFANIPFRVPRLLISPILRVSLGLSK